MHILLIEASLTGHHSIYLESIALAFVNAGNIVTIALPRKVENSDRLKSNLLKYQEVQWFEYNPKFDLDGVGISKLIRREFNVRKVFGEIYDAVNMGTIVDYVFLPYMDYCLYALGLMGSPFKSTNYGGICMRPAFHYRECEVIAPQSRFNIVKRKLFNKLLQDAKLSILFTIDEVLFEYVTKNFLNISKKLVYLADPVETFASEENMIGGDEFLVTQASKVILVYGMLDERKGILLLLDTLENEFGVDGWTVWLFGRQSKSIRDILSSDRWKKLYSQERIKVQNEFISFETEQNALNSCDAIWVAYDGHYGMSGVMVHAGMHNKPIIACQDGLIGWYTRKFGMGILISSNTKSVAEALLKLSNPKYAYELGLIGYRKFCNNNWENFKKTILQN